MELIMKLFVLEDYKNHFIREDGVIISALNKERKATHRPGGHPYTCISVENKKHVIEIYKLIVKVLHKEWDPDIHDVYFADGDQNNLHFDNVKIRSKVQTFKLAEKGIVKMVRHGEHLGWNARTYDPTTKKAKYIGSSADLERGEALCKEKYASWMTQELINNLFNEGKEAKIPKLFV